MGSPYLNSGETIVLTTNRVNVDAGLYEVMLTTERIFLIDEGFALFEPRILPLTLLLSVRGGTTPSHDPAIMLLFRTEEGAGEQPVNLVFSQNKNENRQPERDDWVRNLIHLSISLDERKRPAETPVVPDVTGVNGLRPIARHGVTPDKVRPLSNVSSRQPAPAPITVVPDETVISMEIPAVTMNTSESDSRPAPETVPEEPAPGPDPVCGTPLSLQTRVIIPQIIEELLPAKKMGAPLPVQEQAQPPVMAIPEKAGISADTPAVTMNTSESDSTPAPVTAPEEPAPGPDPVCGTPLSLQTRVIIPQIIEELLPAKKMGAPFPVQEQVPSADFDHEDLFHAVSTAVRSMAIIAEQVPQPRESLGRDPVPETAPHRENIPLPETVPVPEAGVPPPAAAEEEEVPEIIRALHTGATEPDAAEPAAAKEPVPEPATRTLEAGIRTTPESQVIFTIPPDVMQESVGHPAPDAVFRRETEAARAPPIRHPIPPAREIRSLKTSFVYAAVILSIIVLVAVGAMLLPKGPVHVEIPVTPPPGIAQAATLLPETVQPASIPPVTMEITSPVPVLPAYPVPQAGVWVRVNSSAYYFGTVGNPELMQPVSGTGDHFYTVLRSDRPVQVSVQKQDNSGALLAVGIYRDGTLIGTRSVTSPMGTVDLLIDPLTARAPGMTENDTHAEHASPPTGLENY